MATKAQRAEAETERQERENELRAMIDKTDGTVYTILRHVSSSGMTRDISLLIVVDGKLVDLTWWLTTVFPKRFRRSPARHAIRIGGCGMDMGFALVYDMCRALWPNGYECTGDKCRSNDHSNSPYPKRKAGSMHHNDGGHRLRHEWS